MPDRYRVEPGSRVKLAQWDTRDTTVSGDKGPAKEEFDALNLRLEELQELLYAEGKHRLLIVLQGLDTSGKDGTIRHVFDRTNPQGVNVASFKVPSAREAAHDYLWRVHQRTPGNGEIVIFNRSHYEEVIAARVLELVPPAVWRKRFRHINEFERMLTEEGVTLVKFFLNISKKEQRERLQARIDTPQKRWKFAKSDLTTRARWDDYFAAYEQTIERTSTDWAQWYIIPADRKWVRNLVISRILVEQLERLDMRYPAAEEGLDGIVID